MSQALKPRTATARSTRGGRRICRAVRDKAPDRRSRRSEGAGQVADTYATDHGVDLRTVELDVLLQASVNDAVATVLADRGRIDVLIHNAGHLVAGPAEAFTPEEIARVHDVNVLGTQRVNRAVLPHLRAQQQGLLVWMSSSSVRGGTPPFMGPYFAAKAAMDAMAVGYAAELARYNIETAIVVPGAFTRGTDHWALRSGPGDATTAQAYEKEYARVLATPPAGSVPSRQGRRFVQDVSRRPADAPTHASTALGGTGHSEA
jgi:NAD(P)-dependent dehydrogenase (short-subunit alcohol dehydrogenase family)